MANISFFFFSPKNIIKKRKNQQQMPQECGCVFIEIYREITKNKKNLIAFKETVDAKEFYVADGILHHN